MNDLLQQGLAKNLISFDADQKNITYVRQNKRLRFTDPEEKVRANAYLSLVIDYGYAPEQSVTNRGNAEQKELVHAQ